MHDEALQDVTNVTVCTIRVFESRNFEVVRLALSNYCTIGQGAQSTDSTCGMLHLGGSPPGKIFKKANVCGGNNHNSSGIQERR